MSVLTLLVQHLRMGLSVQLPVELHSEVSETGDQLHLSTPDNNCELFRCLHPKVNNHLFGLWLFMHQSTKSSTVSLYSSSSPPLIKPTAACSFSLMTTPASTCWLQLEGSGFSFAHNSSISVRKLIRGE